MDRVRVGEHIRCYQRACEAVGIGLAQPNADAVRGQPPTPLPARLVDQLWDATHQRLQRPILRAGDMPEVEGQQVGAGEDTRGQLVGGEIVGEVVQDLVDAAELTGEQFCRVHTYPPVPISTAQATHRAWIVLGRQYS